MKAKTVLVIDDNTAHRALCKEVLAELDMAAIEAGDGASALARAAEQRYDCILLDLQLPDASGLDLVPGLLAPPNERCPIIVITGHGTIESAVTALKLGASDYLQKPLNIDDFEQVLLRNLASRNDSTGNANVEIQEKLGMVGSSPEMARVMETIGRVSRGGVTVIIYGESGTGKELAARAVHARGPHAAEPFIPVDCSALAPTIVESELFGHVKGAFTGAAADRNGLLRLAGKGTVFLDEIFDLPDAMQSNLLRVLQERTVRPVGSEQFFPVEARVVAASQKDLSEAVQQGQFRRDLFYRLHVVPIHLPPLRERTADIPALAAHFMKKHASDAYPARTISEDAVSLLCEYAWPGNIRELENLIQRVIVFCDEETIDRRHLPESLHRGTQPHTGPRPRGSMADAERKAVEDALTAAKGNKREAARKLGISKTTLYKKLRDFGIG
ncbi:sigma-54-dependent transcriptional regulator [Planctomycetota bacterium]